MENLWENLLAKDVNDNAPCLSERVVRAFFASRLAPTVFSDGPANTFLHPRKRRPEGRLLRYCPNLRPNPPGTPWISVSSQGPLGLIDRLQPLSQR